ncbi:MAG: GrpB family protein [Egibacteraceae bacterium]
MDSDVELIGGPEQRMIELVAHQPSWKQAFEEHRRRIERSLGGTARRVEHIGSTAVPGLPAKPIVDIQVSVIDVENETQYMAPMTDAGYKLRVREPAHRMFRTPELDAHVHLCSASSVWERRHLLFRDWLRHSAADRALYAETKRDLATRSWPTMTHYADAKTDVIEVIMARAEAWARSTVR